MLRAVFETVDSHHDPMTPTRQMPEGGIWRVSHDSAAPLTGAATRSYKIPVILQITAPATPPIDGASTGTRA